MKYSCSDCGTSPVNHKIAYWSIVVNWVFWPLTCLSDKLFSKFAHRLEPLISDYLASKLLKFFARLGIAKIKTEPDAQDELMLQCMWEEAIKRGIKIEEFILLNKRRGICIAYYKERIGRRRPPVSGLRHNCLYQYFFLKNPDKQLICCFDRLPRPLEISQSINWMDNKSILKKKFIQAGIPVARGQAVFCFGSAKKVFHSLGKPVIVKPHIGSGSRHTIMHIIDEGELVSAVNCAKKLSPLVIIEEELIGPVYRITSIGGKIVGIIRRDKPQVFGTGRSTIKSLVEKENQNIKRQGPLFSKILIDEEAELELKRQNLTWMAIPKKGQAITFNQKINWSLGGTTTDVTDSVHPDNIELFEKITLFLGDPLIGIDFIIADMTKSWTNQPRCGVIECNSLPFIDNHHFPFNGQPRNAAGALWDIIFPESGN